MKILLIDDEPDIHLLVSRVLENEDHEISIAMTGEEGLDRIARDLPDMVLVDLKLPGVDGVEVIRRSLERWPDLPMVVLTGHGSVQSAVAAMKAGAFDYLVKPVDPDELALAARRIQEKIVLVEENRYLRAQASEAGSEWEYFTTNGGLRSLLEQVGKVARTEATVLITGESGTGKTVLAKVICRASPRRDRPFVVVNCAALPEQLLESELFGHAKGSFTGAFQDRKGYFEVADGGTIFLDEIGELTPSLQVKLLRILQEKEFVRIGETRTRKADVRIIAATNRDLKKRMEEGALREDFYYRLNVLSFRLPPLRERPEDILPYFQRFVREFAHQMKKPASEISGEVAGILQQYGWPGNIRELRNLAERTAILCDRRIGADALPPEIGSSGGGEAPVSLKRAKHDFEMKFLIRHLRIHRGNVAATARAIGVHVVALRQKLAKLGIDVDAIRTESRGSPA